tara:strand:- start:778 stop:969 length:192 start_codon:yes stop_codon:yes gene_type:complete
MEIFQMAFLTEQTYSSFDAFLADRDADEKITGNGEGGIHDIKTKEFLGYWVHNTDNTVLVAYA